MTSRHGFALLAVLWIITGAAIVAFAISLEARQAVVATGNRRALLRAEWQAEDCIARVRVVLAELSGRRTGAPFERASAPDDSLSLLVTRSPIVATCPGEVDFVPVGLTLDLNSASAEMMRRTLRHQGIEWSNVDSMVDAFLDWRDVDAIPRLRGCESACYAGRGGATPRDGRFASVEELRGVRGFERWDSRTPRGRLVDRLDRLFTVELGRVLIARAPLEVLVALPGIGEEGARELIARRGDRSNAAPELLRVGASLTGTVRDSFVARFPELMSVATVAPDAWLLTVSAPSRDEAGRLSPLGVSMQVRLALGSDGARIIRRRVLP